MYAMVASWMMGLQRSDPRDVYTIQGGSRFSAAGVHAWRDGLVNCITFSREPFPSEVREFKQQTGSAPIMIPVAQGSYATPHDTFVLAVYVNSANPLRRLTIPELREVLGQHDHRPPRIKHWGQLGLSGALAARPVHVYGMTPLRASGDPPGIVNFLNLRVMRGIPWRDDLRAQQDTHHAAALAAIVQRVAHDPDGIGYSGIGYATSGVVALALSGSTGTPYYLPTLGNVRSDSYPLTRTIYLGFPSNLSRWDREAVCNLLTVVLSQPGQQEIRSATHFNPLAQGRLSHAKRLADTLLSCISTGGVHTLSPKRYRPEMVRAVQPLAKSARHGANAASIEANPA